MATAKEHSRILIAEGKAKLKPIGFVHKGTSRTFISDEGLWACVVEFQPGRGIGSYLNVSAHFLWTNRDYLSFDYGASPDGDSRVHGFEAATDDVQFRIVARQLAEEAGLYAERLRKTLTDTSAIAEALYRREHPSPDRGGCWNAYDCGVAFGLTGDLQKSKKMLEKVAANPTPYEWMTERQKDCYELLASLGTPKYREIITSRMRTSRNRLRLAEIALDDF